MQFRAPQQVKIRKQKEVLYLKLVQGGHKGRMIGAELNKKQKAKVVKKYEDLAKNLIKQLNKKEKFLIIASLYWAEGSKKAGSFNFTNSDPIMIKIVSNILINDFDVNKNDLMPRLSINVIHKDRIEKVLKFWSDLLGLPVESFGKPYLSVSKQKKVYHNHDDYFGVLALKVKNGTKYRYQVLGLIKSLIGCF